jgi:hypothetical protein
MELFETIEAELAELEDEPVYLWRLEQLEQAGYDDDLAHEIAGRSDIDLHRAIKLCSLGCPPETAFRILA